MVPAMSMARTTSKTTALWRAPLWMAVAMKFTMRWM